MATAELPTRRYYTGYGTHVAEFIENFIIQSKGRWAGKPLILERWEREVLDELYLMRDGPRDALELVYREALIGIARKNGKSTFSAGIALHGLVAAGENAPEVYAAAAADPQARIVFDQAVKFVQGSPKLREWLRCYRSAIECKSNGGVFRVLSADGPLQHGLNPSLVVIDELWAHKNPELYYALTTGQGARENPLIVTITTAGWDRESVAYQVYEHGEALASQGIEAMRDQRFLHKWYSADDDAESEDRKQWMKANPASWIDLEQLERERKRLPENVFRRLHMNQWTEVEDAWIKPHEWDRCRGRPKFDPDTESYMAVDVGVRRDSTAIVWGQWHDNKLHIGQRILDPGKEPATFGVADIRHAVAQEASRMAVKELDFDPWSFRESAELLLDMGFPMVEFPQHPARMSPASEQLYELVIDGRLIHDGNLTMRAQVLAAVVAPTDRGGWRISKRVSLDRIDGAVAMAMMAVRAIELRYEPPQRKGLASF